MPLRGGPSDKFGNRFEGRWTALQLVNVLDETADSVRLEPPGAEGEGVEFWVRRGRAFEYHQVKRQYGAEGRWTIASLNERGVLTSFQERLANPNASCVFVSTHSVQHLDDLIDYACRANSYAEFDREFLKAASLRASFAKLRSCWLNAAVETCFQYLKRLAIRTIDEETLQFLVEGRIAVLVDGQPANAVVALLAQFALDQIHRELTALEIWQFLQANGCSRREWNKDPHVLAAVESQNNRYLAPLKAEAIRGELFERVETKQVLEKLLSDQKSRGVAVVGEAGIGKSSITPQILERLVSLGWPTLAFRVNQVEPSTVPDKVGEDLGLPGSPARVLAAIAQGTDAVLIVDQLDTVSLVSGRSPEFFDCINEIIQQALSYPNIHVVLGCRRFDLENDPRLMRLVNQSEAEIIKVNRLSPEEIRHQVQKLNLDSDRLTKKQNDLFSVPLHLSLLSEIAMGDSTFTFNFETVKELYDKFWNRKQELVRARVGRDVQWTEIIDTLCDT